MELNKIRKIIHIDMDCFYAAIEQRDRPELRGRPVAVSGAPGGRAVLTTASYEARKFGVRSAMPTRQALKLCPELILVPVNFSKYKLESQRIREVFYEYTDLVEPLSLDEAFLDVTDAPHCRGSATLMAQEIRQKILIKTGLTASAGIAPNKFVAKVASDWHKPNGQKVVLPNEVSDFVAQLPVEKIFGVGKVTAEKLHLLGYKTCADLRAVDLESLLLHFKGFASTLYHYSRGQDDRAVDPSSERKSLSVEETFVHDVPVQSIGAAQMAELYLDFSQRYFMAEQAGTSPLLIHKIFVKVKFSDFKQKTKEKMGREFPPIEEFVELYQNLVENSEESIRLLGLGVRFYTEKPETDQLKFFTT